ncbi:hypothetical protein GCM10008960_18570 [Deinococcus sedimenti]|uniref:Secreted protein n=1 Tax=Deinococcus sedimenti TaxID=1867090 RepID=A0ABQ2S386_9DEIO|nr:hypothetical protein GCM10008960_18570 [Deinococcus sedimenti]
MEPLSRLAPGSLSLCGAVLRVSSVGPVWSTVPGSPHWGVPFWDQRHTPALLGQARPQAARLSGVSSLPA